MTGGTHFLKSIFRKPLWNNLIEKVFRFIYIHLNYKFFALDSRQMTCKRARYFKWYTITFLMYFLHEPKWFIQWLTVDKYLYFLNVSFSIWICNSILLFFIVQTLLKWIRKETDLLVEILNTGLCIIHIFVGHQTFFFWSVRIYKNKLFRPDWPHISA